MDVSLGLSKGALILTKYGPCEIVKVDESVYVRPPERREVSDEDVAELQKLGWVAERDDWSFKIKEKT